MNWLRKIGNWLWLNKERMVLAVMVCILIFRVYQVLNPGAEGINTGVFQPPRDQIPADDPRLPQLPPLVSPNPVSEDWSKLWRFSLFTYRQPRQGGPGGRSPNQSEELDLTLLQIRSKGDGTWLAQIKTASRTAWKEKGESFEQYTLQEIDPDTQCVTIFSEQRQQPLTICVNK